MKGTRNFVAGLLVGTLFLGNATVALAANTFTDVPESHWSYAFVEKAASSNLVSGTGNGLFAPEHTVSNAEWATMLTNLLRAENDVIGTSNPWWRIYMEYARRSGFLGGTEVLRSWEDNGLDWVAGDAVSGISRYDMAQVIYNVGTHWAQPDTSDIQSKIEDWSSIPENYQSAVAYCFAAGFVTGVNDAGKFDGTATMTRGAAAVVLCRMLDAANGTHDFDAGGNGTGAEIGGSYVSSVLSVNEYVQNGYSYQISVNTSYRPGTLANGKAVNEANMLEILAELKEAFPAGTSWGGENFEHEIQYYYNGGGTLQSGGGCISWVSMTANLLYGCKAPYTTHTDLYSAKCGDVIRLLNEATGSEHWIVVTGVSYDSEGLQIINACEGNASGKVSWDLSRYVSSTANRLYPNSVVYSFY